jgi:hypothetical protein
MAHDEVSTRGLMPAENVKFTGGLVSTEGQLLGRHIPATERCVSDLHDNVFGILNSWDWALFNGHLQGSFKDDRLHLIFGHLGLSSTGGGVKLYGVGETRQ